MFLHKKLFTASRKTMKRMTLTRTTTNLSRGGKLLSPAVKLAKERNKKITIKPIFLRSLPKNARAAAHPTAPCQSLLPICKIIIFPNCRVPKASLIAISTASP